jgi:hypothetical protein
MCRPPVYKAIEKIKNVYIAKFYPGEKEPKQEKWVSRESNIYMTKADGETILWDIDNGLIKIKSPQTGAIETNPLTEGNIAIIEKKIRGSLGLMPFESMSDIPAGHSWNKVTDKHPPAAAEGFEVYDLTWTEEAHNGSVVSKKWRFFIAPETYLPQKTEFYEKLPIDSKYILRSTNIVEYLDKGQIRDVLKTEGF